MLNAKPHTLYCRWNKFFKDANVANGGPASGSAAATQQTFGGNTTPSGGKGKGGAKGAGGRKRKQDSSNGDDSEEGEKAKVKKGKGSKGVKVKDEPVDDDAEGGRERFATPAENFGGKNCGYESEEDDRANAFAEI
jgi:hypothetical protein